MISWGLLIVGNIIAWLLMRKGWLHNPLDRHGEWNISLMKYFLSLILGCLGQIMVGMMFELRGVGIVWLISSWLWMVPFLWMWHRQHQQQRQYFIEITTYLNHFVACFKQSPMMYQVLIECRNVVGKELAIVIDQALQTLSLGERLKAIDLLLKQCPHFIVNNLYQLVMAVEVHGAVDYYESLNIIQNDIEDWMEDTLIFQQLQQTLRSRLLLLSGFAVAIAFMVKMMLVNAMIDVSSDFYQLTMVLFGLVIHLTIGMSQRLLHHSWLQKGELLC